MDTPRSVLESYCAGEFVQATDLRASVAWMLAAWDEAVAGGRDVATATSHDRRKEAVTAKDEG